MDQPTPFVWGALYMAGIYFALGMLFWPHYEPIGVTLAKAVVFGLLMQGLTELKQRRSRATPLSTEKLE